MTTALESRIAAIENRLNPGAAQRRVNDAEIAEANEAFTAAAARRQKVAKEYLPAIAKLRAAIEALGPVSAAVVALVAEDADAWNAQHRAVDRGATGNIDNKLPGAGPNPEAIAYFLKGLDDTVALARKFGLVR